jgi:hypothetical protein
VILQGDQPMNSNLPISYFEAVLKHWAFVTRRSRKYQSGL